VPAGEPFTGQKHNNIRLGRGQTDFIKCKSQIANFVRGGREVFYLTTLTVAKFISLKEEII
jgi:hypothetical protein